MSTAEPQFLGVFKCPQYFLKDDIQFSACRADAWAESGEKSTKQGIMPMYNIAVHRTLVLGMP